MSVRFVACPLALGFLAVVACGDGDPGQAQNANTSGSAGEAVVGAAGEGFGGAPNLGSGARPGGAAGTDSAAGGDSGEAGSAGGCNDEACECSLGERGCPCRASADCADGLACHPALGCASVCVGPNEGFVIEDARALAELIERQCDAIEGSLWLVAPDIEDVTGLDSLKVVSADLVIRGAERLANLQGLAGVEALGGSLVVQGNAALRDLSGFEGLRSIGRASDVGSVVITENGALTSIAALAVADISRLSVTVANNPELARLAGLSGARSLSNVVIVDNESLESLNGLAGVTDLESLTVANNAAVPDVNLPALERAGAFTLTGNTRLAQLRMPALSRLEMALTVAANPVLESIEMTALESVAGSVTISANAGLARLELEGLESVGALTVSGNARLPQCEVDALNVRLQNPCAASCSGNDSGGVCP
jgi:hypothetical protein